MEREILRFARDDEDHWLAELPCGHSQHTRHNPPLSTRPWVLTAAGRESRVGTSLDCRRCNDAELPAGYAVYQQTRAFTHETVPAGLLDVHTTKPGVWALIHVAEGSLEYVRHSPFDDSQTLAPGSAGVVLPEVEHHLVCAEPVQFYVEFWRPAPATESPKPEEA